MRILILLPVLALLAFAQPAAAQSPVAPSGNSGVDQYLESVPSATGDRSPPARHGSSRSQLSPRTRRALRALGGEGNGIQTLVAATAPVGSSDRSNGGGVSSSQRDGSGRRGGQDGAGAGGSSALPPSVSRSLTRAAVGSDVGGMGALFPLLLVGSLLVAAVFRFVIRGRR